MPMSEHDGVRVTPYLVAFGALLALTVATVAVSWLALPATPAMLLGLTIATVKASLVAVAFMHITSARATVFLTLALTATFCAALFGLILWTEADHVLGTEFTNPFESQGGTQ